MRQALKYAIRRVDRITKVSVAPYDRIVLEGISKRGQCFALYIHVIILKGVAVMSDTDSMKSFVEYKVQQIKKE